MSSYILFSMYLLVVNDFSVFIWWVTWEKHLCKVNKIELNRTCLKYKKNQNKTHTYLHPICIVDWYLQNGLVWSCILFYLFCDSLLSENEYVSVFLKNKKKIIFTWEHWIIFCTWILEFPFNNFDLRLKCDPPQQSKINLV